MMVEWWLNGGGYDDGGEGIELNKQNLQNSASKKEQVARRLLLPNSQIGKVSWEWSWILTRERMELARTMNKQERMGECSSTTKENNNMEGFLVWE